MRFLSYNFLLPATGALFASAGLAAFLTYKSTDIPAEARILTKAESSQSSECIRYAFDTVRQSSGEGPQVGDAEHKLFISTLVGCNEAFHNLPHLDAIY